MKTPRDPRNGQLVFCDQRPFRIVNGRRVWLTPPPPALLAELLLEQERLALIAQASAALGRPITPAEP